MNQSLVGLLIQKDWQLNRVSLIGYMLVGFLSLWLFTINGKIPFLIGVVLLISAVISIGAHLVFTTVINERKHQNLAFVMSLPVTYAEYTLAKIISNMAIAGFGWLILLFGMNGLIIYSANIPDGLIPYASIIMGYLMVIYAVLLAAALVSESEAWSIVTMTVLNISISIFMIWLGGLDDIKPYIKGDVAVWNNTALSFIGVEILIIVVAIAVTFFLQSRKRSYL